MSAETQVEHAPAEPAMLELGIQKKHPLAIRWFHWVNFPVLFLMIWSGLLIYWANRAFHIHIFRWDFGPLFPDSWYSPKAPAWIPGWLSMAGTDDNGNPGRYLWVMDHRLAEGMAWHFTIAW